MIANPFHFQPLPNTGILKKWQLIFYGTATNPIRLRNRNPAYQGAPFAVLQNQAPSSQRGGFALPPTGFSGFGGDFFAKSFQNLPDIFAAGSNIDVSVVVDISQLKWL